jgi:hypothetical protein
VHVFQSSALASLISLSFTLKSVFLGGIVPNIKGIDAIILNQGRYTFIVISSSMNQFSLLLPNLISLLLIALILDGFLLISMWLLLLLKFKLLCLLLMLNSPLLLAFQVLL